MLFKSQKKLCYKSHLVAFLNKVLAEGHVTQSASNPFLWMPSPCVPTLSVMLIVSNPLQFLNVFVLGVRTSVVCTLTWAVHVHLGNQLLWKEENKIYLFNNFSLFIQFIVSAWKTRVQFFVCCLHENHWLPWLNQYVAISILKSFGDLS